MTAPLPINYDMLRAMFERQDAERAETASASAAIALRAELIAREVENDREDHDA